MLNVSQAVGSRRAGNPLYSLAEDTLNGGVNTSAYLNKHSTTDAVLGYLYDKSRYTPAAQMNDGSGRVNIMSAVQLAITRGELSPEEGRAFIEQFKMMKDPQYQRRMREASQGTADKQMNQWLSQQGYDTLSGVPLIGGLLQSARELNRDVLSGSSGVSGAFTSMRAGMADKWDSFQASLQGRRNERDRPVARFSMENGVQTRTELDIGSYVQFAGNERRLMTTMACCVNSLRTSSTRILTQSSANWPAN